MPQPPGQKSSSENEPASVRGEYERLGVQRFYETEGATYRNPHEPDLRAVIEDAVTLWRPNLSHVLDLAAGSGEATLILQELGAGRVDGVDPYTFNAYQSRTGCPAERLTFADITAGAMTGRRYSLIVCSFALHLCELSRLPMLAQRLSEISPALLILTPHKRPEIRDAWGWKLVGEFVLHRVRARMYESSSFLADETSKEPG